MKFTNIRFIDPTNNGAESYYYNTSGAPANMTSNENQLWKVSSSSVYSNNHEVWRAFNLNSTPEFFYHSGNESTTWVQWQSKESQKTITSYSIVNDIAWRTNPDIGSNWYATAWRFEGSDDGSVWTEIDSRNSISFGSGEKKTFVISNPQPFYYHRIVKTAGRGNYFSPQAIMASTNTPVERPEETTNGLTPSTAWKNLPTYDNLVDDCLYIIRRTDRDSFCILPNLPNSTSLATMTNFAFVGCPKSQDEWFDLLTPELQSALISSGWMSDNYTYANIRQMGMDKVNMKLSSCKNFYMRNINITRDTSPCSFADFDNRWLFYFNTTSYDNVDIQYCRFAGTGIDLDDSSYINRYPSICQSYVRADAGKNFVFNNNIVCYVNHNRATNEITCEYGLYFCGGRILNFSFSGNKVYFTQENRFSVTSDYRAIIYNDGNYGHYFRDKYFIIVGYQNSGRNNYGPIENILFNNNDFIFRACDYADLGGLIWLRYFRRLEFTNNNVYSGTHMSDYDFQNTRKVFIHGRKFIMIGNKSGESSNVHDNPYEELIVKNININLPELWCVGSGNCYSRTNTDTNSGYYHRGAVLWICATLENYYRAMGTNDASPYYTNHYGTRYGGTRTCTFRKEISNINITLGEGPAYNEESSDKTFAIDQLYYDNSHSVFRGYALIISGIRKYGYNSGNDYSVVTYVHDISPFGFNVSNINSSSPWTYALSCWNCCLKGNINIRGGFETSVCYAEIDNLSLKYSRRMIASMDYDTVIIKNLVCENNDYENNIYYRKNGYGNFIVYKTNVSTFSNGSYWGDAYNEAYMCDREIGTSKKFKYRTNAFFIESCNVKRNNKDTLKIYGDSRFTSDRHMRITAVGDDVLSSRILKAGKYKITVHCGFTGADLIEKTISNPTDDNYNVLRSCRPVIKTDTEIKFLNDTKVLETNDWSLTNDFYPFDACGYIDIHNTQKVNLGLKFGVISANYLNDGSGSAVFIDPKFDCDIIELYDESDSNSN